MLCPISIKLICEIFASRSIVGVVTPAISSTIREPNQEYIPGGGQRLPAETIQAKRMTDKMIKAIDSFQIRSCLAKLPYGH